MRWLFSNAGADEKPDIFLKFSLNWLWDSGNLNKHLEKVFKTEIVLKKKVFILLYESVLSLNRTELAKY